MNTSLLVLGFIFLGKGFGIKTVYASMVMSVSLSLLERVCPLSRPLTTEPLLELLFAIFLPAVGTAILFHLGASSGGTDIIAMILKKYTSLNIGTVLMLVDVAAAASSFFIFGPETGLFSTIGLAAKSLVIDDVIENLNLCKCFNIICDDPRSGRLVFLLLFTDNRMNSKFLHDSVNPVLAVAGVIEMVDPACHPPISQDMSKPLVILLYQFCQFCVFGFLLWNCSVQPFIVSSV